MSQENLSVPNESPGKSHIKSLTKSISPWMSFHGWLYVVIGVSFCFTVVGVLIGVPLIVAGTALVSASGECKRFSASGDIAELEMALKEQKKFFMISGLVCIVTVIMPLVLFFSFILSIFFGNGNLDINQEFDDFMDNVPKLQKQIPYEFGKGREV